MKRFLVVFGTLLMAVMIVSLSACSSSPATPPPSSSAPAVTTPTSAPATVPATTAPPVTAAPSSSAQPTGTSQAGAKTLTIGIATPLTGTEAFLGTQISDAVQMAISDQNTKGGVTIGGQQYTLVPMIRDTKGDAATGKNIDQEMISDGVKLIFGPFQADAVAMQPDIEANKVLTFFVQCLSPEMTGPSKPYSFFISWPIPQETFKLLEYIQKTYPQAKTVYSMEADTPDAISFIAATQEACKAFGYNYLGSDKVPVTTTDFSSDIAKVMSNNPDIIDTGNIGGVMGGLGAQLIKQLGQAGFKGEIMIPAAPPEEVVEQTVSPEYLNNVVTQYINVNGPVVDPKYAAVMNEFQAKYNQPAVDVVSGYYNAATALFQFLGTQNTMDSTTWMQGFAAYKWDGIMGFQSQWVGLAGDGINRRVLNNQWVTHYVNGKPVTDYTAPLPQNLFFDANGNPITLATTTP